MTKRQIEKKLVAAGFRMDTVVEIGRDYVEVMVKEECSDRADGEFTEAAAELAAEVLGFFGGYRTGYGSWIVAANFAGITQDYCTQEA
jgi:hypothetical protein